MLNETRTPEWFVAATSYNQFVSIRDNLSKMFGEVLELIEDQVDLDTKKEIVFTMFKTLNNHAIETAEIGNQVFNLMGASSEEQDDYSKKLQEAFESTVFVVPEELVAQ